MRMVLNESLKAVKARAWEERSVPTASGCCRAVLKDVRLPGALISKERQFFVGLFARQMPVTVPGQSQELSLASRVQEPGSLPSPAAALVRVSREREPLVEPGLWPRRSARCRRRRQHHNSTCPALWVVTGWQRCPFLTATRPCAPRNAALAGSPVLSSGPPPRGRLSPAPTLRELSLDLVLLVCF